MSGLVVHRCGDMQGWHAIAMPPTEALNACPCCEAELTTVFKVSDKQDEIGVTCCDHCGYVGYDKLPTQQWLDDYYAGDWMSGESLDPPPNHPLADILSKIMPKHKSILEIGCGKGACLASLRARGYHTLAGVEQSQHRAQASAKHTGLDINSDWPDGHWDVVTSFHVLEHFRNPSVFFEQASARQTRGDFIVVVVPKAEWEPVLGQLLFILHLHSFSADSLAMLGHRHGYAKVADYSNEDSLVHVYSKYPAAKPDCLGYYVDAMNTKLARGLRLADSANENKLRWRIFDTYATYRNIKDPHRSLCVSSCEQPGMHFDNDQCMFVK
ncbi:MAG: class I SAM-dependent methyltransferase [Cellvibrionaceae bacterium]|nr:class I SAM-dependent methyltransferase [Cellvibrionaceae bacterium]